MRFKVGCELTYQVNNPSTFLFALNCIETGGQHIHEESLVVTPEAPSEEFTIGIGMNRFSRLRVKEPGPLQINYAAEVDISTRVVPAASLHPDGPAKLVPEAIPFLFPSRYCPSDALRQEALNHFGHLTNVHAIAAAISDWVHENISYQSGASNEQTSADDTYRQRQGVCRDFAHLSIAFCRAMNIPARYLTCYAYQLQPPDFHACFEVFIDDLWYVFDATRLVPLNGLVRIATGRDASDAAVCTIFGNTSGTSMKVTSECLDPNFQPVTRDSLAANNEAIALL